jgi:hypothetical protein
MKKWSLQVVDGVTSDGASDARNASAVIADATGAWVLICFSHNISLVIGDCNDVLAEVLDKVGKILNVYNKSDVLGLLAEMSKERGTFCAALSTVARASADIVRCSLPASGGLTRTFLGCLSSDVIPP